MVLNDFARRGEGMDLPRLHALLAAERRSESLQELPERFGEEVARYLAGLEESAGEGGGGEFAADELRTARQLVEGLVDERLLKLAKAAVFRARGSAEEPRALAAWESELFLNLTSLLGGERGKILKAVSLPGPAPKRRGAKTAGGAAQAPPAAADSVLLRILQDIPPFSGADGRVYRLRKEEEVRLPRANAEPLLKRGVAKRVEPEL